MKKILLFIIPALIVSNVLVFDLQTSKAVPLDPATPPPCSPDYLMTLHHSNTYKESDWDMMFTQIDFEDITSMNDIINYSLKINEFTDLNGDRREDFVRVFSNNHVFGPGELTLFNEFKACVHLNTGKGFKVAHNCYAKVTGTVDAILTQDYYGDCAL